MLITRTPFRISFFGGGTDYREYYEQFGGCVLTTTVDKYCYVTLRELPPFFDYKSQLTYSKIERFNKAEELEHPLVREALKMMAAERLQIAYDADLPARSGIGSSSSFAVGLLNGLHAIKGELLSPLELAVQAIELERERCNEAGGVQDQLAVAFGGLNRFDFSADGFAVKPVLISAKRKRELSDSMLMMFTGFTHFAGAISEEQRQSIPVSLASLSEMKALVSEGERLLNSDRAISEFGALLSQAWSLKRGLSGKITNPQLDSIFSSAIAAGASGGKLLGAGGGGFMLLIVEPEKQKSFIEKMGDYRFVPVALESDGTKILYSGGENK